MPGNGIGVFGKLPSRGDFLSRSLPPSFVDPFHAWLSRGLADAKERLGPRFEPAYMQAPVWRFALAPGACGDARALGILMPSVDAVGRNFPLAILGFIGWTPDPGRLVLDLAGWFGELERRALLVLEDGFALQPWLAELEGFALPPEALGRAESDDWTRLSGSGAELFRAVREGIGRYGLTSVSLFWTEGSPFVAAGALLGRGLPNCESFARLLADDPAPPPLSEASQ
jgi:type VI secretion system protein ImpM